MDDSIGYISFRIEAKIIYLFIYFEKIYLETNGMILLNITNVCFDNNENFPCFARNSQKFKEEMFKLNKMKRIET